METLACGIVPLPVVDLEELLLDRLLLLGDGLSFSRHLLPLELLHVDFFAKQVLDLIGTFGVSFHILTILVTVAVNVLDLGLFLGVAGHRPFARLDDARTKEVLVFTRVSIVPSIAGRHPVVEVT